MHLERQAKRYLFSQPQAALVYPAPGCHEALQQELGSLLVDLRTPTKRSPRTKDLRDAILVDRVDYRTLLELTLRVMSARDLTLLLAEGPVHNREGLAGLLATVRWPLFLAQGDAVALRTETHDSSLYHEGILRECAQSAVAGAGATIAPAGAGEAVHRLRLRIVRNRGRVELSLAGSPLWIRGYRSELHARAPIREDLAQSAIRLARAPAPATGAHGGARLTARPELLLIPFSGSGTLLFEYLIARYSIPAFLFGRGYAFEHFPAGSPPSVAWIKGLLTVELGARLLGLPPLHALLLDTDAAAIESARRSWELMRARLSEVLGRSSPGGQAPPVGPPPITVEFLTMDVFSRGWREWAADAADTGAFDLFVALNPPYGLRLRNRAPEELYRRIGRECAALAAMASAGAARGFLLCPTEATWQAALREIGALNPVTTHLTHGGLDVRLCRFASYGAMSPRDQEGEKKNTPSEDGGLRN